MAEKRPLWDTSIISAVCDVLAATGWPGLTWSEIEQVLPFTGVKTVAEASNKRTRLWVSLNNTQADQQAGNCVILFITHAMKPARYVNDPARFHALRDGLNEALSLNGMRVSEQGQLVKGAVAKTLTEVAELTGRLKTELARRQVHPEVIKYCNEELLKKSIFHAMFEACKGLAERIRQITGLTQDGAELIDAAFSTANDSPPLKINAFVTQNEKSDHRGLGNLIRGVFGTFRNNAAHAPRIMRAVKEQDALDLFCTLSYIHRRLDEAP